MSVDSKYMTRAIELALKGVGFTSPNPLVGAVIVKNGRIIGEGYHERYGELHAERNALKNCCESPNGADIYVTLEPCCHHGKQPPCTDALIEAGIKNVIIGSFDPNPKVSGKGTKILRDAGITVTEGFLREECDRINEIFFHYITCKTPFVAMKYAMTMDGKIAAYTGASKWITGEEARGHVHTLRHKYRGIMVGINTVLMDDPMLNCRIDGLRSPVRIICDSHLRTPMDSNLVKTAGKYETIIATGMADKKLIKEYENKGILVIQCPSESGVVDLKKLLNQLGERNIDSILLEGGGTLNWSFLECDLVNKVYTYIAPMLLGGDGSSPVKGIGFPNPQAAVRLINSKVIRIGEDYLIESGVKRDVYRDN